VRSDSNISGAASPNLADLRSAPMPDFQRRILPPRTRIGRCGGRCAESRVPSQLLRARSAVKVLRAGLSFDPFSAQNPTTVLRRNPKVETRSRPAPMRLSNAYFSILLRRHSYRKFNNIRVPRVAHNPKVVGSNPTPATNQINGLERIRKPIHSHLLPIRNRHF
jgi:hypothetical protein